eukprot:TRINITY_DN2917_c1_g1_i1.p1 TRINITY_DN2917_c1_g1~~TRINITY_DN2917_c1_g1_i1.p1  ORF type:complete len:282 (+),score=62.44 TRINITY_DN2917_c1_g1_i1:286-1131(+)
MSWGKANELGEEPLYEGTVGCDAVVNAGTDAPVKVEVASPVVRPIAQQRLYKRPAFGVSEAREAQDEEDLNAAAKPRTVEYTKNQFSSYAEQLQAEKEQHSTLKWASTKEQLAADPSYRQRFEEQCKSGGRERRRERVEVDAVEEQLSQLSLKENSKDTTVLEVYDIKGAEVLEAFIIERLGIVKDDLTRVRWLNDNFAYFHFKTDSLEKIPLCTGVVLEEFKTRLWDPANPTPVRSQPTPQRDARQLKPDVNALGRLLKRVVTTNNRLHPRTSPTQAAST